MVTTQAIMQLGLCSTFFVVPPCFWWRFFATIFIWTAGPSTENPQAGPICLSSLCNHFQNSEPHTVSTPHTIPAN